MFKTLLVLSSPTSTDKGTTPLRLTMTSSNLVNYNFVSRIETIIFSPSLIPPTFVNLVNILYGSIVICVIQ